MLKVGDLVGRSTGDMAWFGEILLQSGTTSICCRWSRLDGNTNERFRMALFPDSLTSDLLKKSLFGFLLEHFDV